MEHPREEDEGLQASKRQRTGEGSLVLASPGGGDDPASRVLASLSSGVVPRTSGLEAPTMLLSGHGDAVFSLKFSPDGTHLATGSRDCAVFLWDVYGQCRNYAALRGHKNAVLEVAWAGDGAHLYSASADKTLRAWDGETGQQVKKMAEHKAVVNGVAAPSKTGAPLLASASDDGTARVWDLRVRRSVTTLSGSGHPLCCVAVSPGADTVYTGGVDNTVRAWDLRTGTVSHTLAGHSDTVTGLAVSPDGAHLLSNGMDCALRIWDVRPYAPEERCVRVLTGHSHNFEKNLLRCAWSADGQQVSAGSSDRIVYVWNAATGALLYKLPGHKGSVNEVAFHPKEPIIGSCSSDKTVYLGELSA